MASGEAHSGFVSQCYFQSTIADAALRPLLVHAALARACTEPTPVTHPLYEPRVFRMVNQFLCASVCRVPNVPVEIVHAIAWDAVRQHMYVVRGVRHWHTPHRHQVLVRGRTSWSSNRMRTHTRARVFFDRLSTRGHNWSVCLVYVFRGSRRASRDWTPLFW